MFVGRYVRNSNVIGRHVYACCRRYYCINTLGIQYLNEAVELSKTSYSKPIDSIQLEKAIDCIDKAVNNINIVGRDEFVHAKLLKGALYFEKGNFKKSLEVFDALTNSMIFGKNSVRN